MKDAKKHYFAFKLKILKNSKQNHNFIKNAIDKIKRLRNLLTNSLKHQH